VAWALSPRAIQAVNAGLAAALGLLD